MSDNLRTRIATAITDALADQKHWQGELSPHDLADAVIAALEMAREENNMPTTDEWYRYRYVTEWQAIPGWKPELVQCAYCDYEGTPEELTIEHLNECP